MSKKTKKWLIVVSFLIIAVFSFVKFNERIKMIELTSINVKVENKLDVNKVIVYQGHYTINRKNDTEIFDNKSDQIVFDGNGTGKIKTEYGENDFLVTYDNKYYFQFRQFCTNDNDHYKYNLTILKKANKFYLKANIDGGMKFERQMSLISDAEKLRCNRLIDDDKGVYNGIELRKNNK